MKWTSTLSLLIFFLPIGIGVALYFTIPQIRLTLRSTKDEPSLLPSWPVLPTHVGIIMDGNRRWAKKQGLALFKGHKEGASTAKMVIDFFIKHKVPYLTLYAFSLENFKRSDEELHYLFDILAKELVGEDIQKLYNAGVRVQFVGDRSRFPQQLCTIIDDIENKTAKNSTLFLQILFCYGGRQEIAAAAKKIAALACEGSIKIDQITPELLEEVSWMGSVPPPDLIIRTGYARRLSNFLIMQSAYSELYFLDCFWPEIQEKNLIEALTFYDQCKRTFGA